MPSCRWESPGADERSSSVATSGTERSVFLSLSVPTPRVDRPSLAELYSVHAPSVMRWATRLLGDAQDAADVTQEVFIIAERRLDSFDGHSASDATWLFRITENVVRNRRRSLRRRAAVIEEAEAADSATSARAPDDALHARRSARLVAQVLEQLSQTDRALLVLFELEGLPGEQVAAMLELSPSVIWVRLHRARARFAEKLKVFAPEVVP